MSDALSLHGERDGDTLYVQARGLITLRTARELRAFVAYWMRDDPVLAVLLDMTQCANGLTEDAWVALAQQSVEDVRIDVPMALLVSASQEPAAERYCAIAARLGLPPRMAYVNLYEAMAWVEESMSWPASQSAPLSSDP